MVTLANERENGCRRRWSGAGTYKEAEQLVGLSRTTLWKLIGAGELEHRRVGRAVRINRQSLEAYMSEDAVSGALDARTE